MIGVLGPKASAKALPGKMSRICAPVVIGQLQGPFQRLLAHKAPCQAQSTWQACGLQGRMEQLQQQPVSLQLHSLPPVPSLCRAPLIRLQDKARQPFTSVPASLADRMSDPSLRSFN